jgi:hypothetical protein
VVGTLTVKQLQALINAVDVCRELIDAEEGLDGLHQIVDDFPILKEVDLMELRGILVRQRIAIDPEFQRKLGRNVQ